MVRAFPALIVRVLISCVFLAFRATVDGGAAPGPDAFGYTAITLTNFSFIQITNGSGSRVLAFNDDATASANLGFTFNFYGTNYTNVSFNVNGLMAFVAAGQDYANVNLTSASPTNNQPSLAVLWDDWETQELWADAVYYKTSGTAPFRQFIVQWNKVVPVNGDGTDTVTFEAVLFEGNNRMVFSYLDAVVSDETTNAASLGSGATVGIRDRNGQTNNRNLQWSFNEPLITNGLNLLFAVTNHAPVAVNDSVSTLEDSPVTINVLTNDFDPDGDPVTIVAFTQGTNGLVAINPNNTFTYTPATNVFGSDLFTYVIVDSFGGRATGAVIIAVSAVNDPPTINPLFNLTLLEDFQPQTVNLSGIGPGAPNEADVLVLTANSSDTSIIPTPAINYSNSDPTGTLSFASAANAFGTATITITVDDGRSSNNIVSRSFTVTVNPVNDPPTLDSIGDVTINEDSGLQTVNLTGVSQGAGNEPDVLALTANSSNPGVIPGPTVTYNSVLGTGRVRFTPVTNAFGSALLTVTANDGQPSNNIVSRSFTVTVAPVNDPPILDPLPDLTITENAGTQTVHLTGISSGAPNENDLLTITATSSKTNFIPNPGIAWSSPNSTGTLYFAAASNFFGTATITVSLNDGQPSNNIFARPFTVTVNRVNLPPVANSDSLNTHENIALTVPVSILLTNDTDPDPGDSVSVTAVFGTNSAATVALSGGVITYVPPANFNGQDSFQYTITDGNGGGATGDVIVTIWPPLKVSSIARQTDGHIILQFSGIPGGDYTIETGTDLRDWIVAGAVTETTLGHFQFDDSTAASAESRFYRLRWH
jgi:hypothetical protein